ncbi:MAG TPA: aspartate carbamoyltransferase catalytic subunit [Rhodanobacteraceae bacterium]|nr:aspartate carbamoyltransferase catalytic subunit [Rhodanobacteraceae bacterium]
MTDTSSPRHLVTLENIPSAVLTRLLDRADAMREHAAPDLLAGRTVLNLFFEPSTRTRTSFELAARRLGAWVVNFDTAHSSTSKGETLIDTLHTLEAMNIDALVVRHKEAGTPAFLARQAQSGVAVVNAGDGNRAHPTQGLLDALTIRQQRGDVGALRAVICGDILHSRVARSDIHALKALGVRELRLCGPRALLPAPDEVPGCSLHEDFDEAIQGVDVAIMLRLQVERMTAAMIPDTHSYFTHYGLSAARLRRAAPECLVMHPGPINRGIEIAPEVADGPQSRILAQVANGIPVRQAVLAELLGC